jgi:hypothetical protein
MKLIPDKASRQQFMKKGLTVILGVAWAPIIWLLVTALLSSSLSALTGSWMVTQGVILVFAFAATLTLLRFFVRIGDKFHGSSR